MTEKGRRRSSTIEYGDFQTPAGLAQAVCRLLADRGILPASIVEPTCGLGGFLIAALERFPMAGSALGMDINSTYLRFAEEEMASREFRQRASLICGDFFQTDWPLILAGLPDPLLLIGNPPWVTNARLGVIGSDNLPAKSNFQKRNGLDAITGKANFDISEWMLIRLLGWVDGRNATIAMLCKTAVARKVIAHAWSNGVALKSADIFGINADESFGASVDACLLICEISPGGSSQEVGVYPSLGAKEVSATLGYRNGRVVANPQSLDRWKHLRGTCSLRWRSGIKHDCSRVMELIREGTRYRNGLGELVDLEKTYLYPMLKSSEVAKGSIHSPKRWMLVTQRFVGQDTREIEAAAPKTWAYLERHAEMLDRRGSSIYKKHPRFSIFGVGEYSFAPYKVAISGFYKKLAFTVLGRYESKPVVLDDTCYFVPCNTVEDAEYLAALLNSPVAGEFLSSFVFWEAKRPITVDVLGQLDVVRLAEELGAEPQRAEQILGWTSRSEAALSCQARQRELFPSP